MALDGARRTSTDDESELSMDGYRHTDRSSHVARAEATPATYPGSSISYSPDSINMGGHVSAQL